MRCIRVPKAVAGIVACFCMALVMVSAGASAKGISIIRDTEIENTIRVFSAPIFDAAGLNAADISIHIVNDPSLNAFVAGGQRLFMNTGLLMRADDASEVIGVSAPDILTVDDVRGLDTIGVQRVRIGMPLEPMLHAFRVFGRVVWIEMAQATGPDDAALLAELGGRWMDWIDRASSSAATAYLDASNELVRRLDARRGALLEALLEASTTSDVSAVATEF